MTDRSWDDETIQLFDKAATMLRQQAEIEALKKEAALQRLSDFTQEAAKTLTDGEMWKVCLEGGHVDCIADVNWEIDGMEELKHQYLRLCKAILRKAQEK